MIKAIIERDLVEATYSKYNSIYDLGTLSEYYSAIPRSSRTKFVKFIRFSKGQAAIYNISDILISPNVADGSEGKKIVQIVYSGDEASKVWDVKKFSTVCKKIFNALKDVDEKDVEVQAVLEGQNKPTKFRFYYDADTGFAILVNGTDTKGLEAFLNSYEGELENVVSVPKVTKAPTAPRAPKEPKKDLKIRFSKKPVKKNDHEGYVYISSSDSFGHKIKIWKRDPDYKPVDAEVQDKGEAKTEGEQLKEWDDTHLPRGRVGHHETGIPKKYWIAIGDDILINNYSEFVNQSLQLKPLANNATPSFSTQDINKAKELAKRVVVKFPGKYVFFGVDSTSKGMMTGKNHLRASVRYYYDPTIKAWSDNDMYGEMNEAITKRGYDVNALIQKLSKFKKSLLVQFVDITRYNKYFPITDAVLEDGKVILYPYDEGTGIRPDDYEGEY